MGSRSQHEHEIGKGHVVLFPLMSKGHTIPLLYLSRFFLAQGLAVTVFTTPANRPFIHQSLPAAANVVDIPFPQNIVPGIRGGVESTDELPSMDLFYSFVLSTVHMQPDFERALQTLPRASFMVSDGFLWWTLDSAAKFGFPRFIFNGSGNYACSLIKLVAENRLLDGAKSANELVTVTRFPWIKVTKNDFDQAIITDSSSTDDVQHAAYEFSMKVAESTVRSFGMIVNSFYELEPLFVEYWNTNCLPKARCTGPFFLLAQDEPHDQDDRPIWIEWLDKKLEEGGRVLYVAFGSQAELSAEQLQEIALGLENSMVNFLWVMRSKSYASETATWDIKGFEGRVNGRGMVVNEWVNQRRILMHGSVHGFVSHCGWNSVLESICAGVPILAWPIMAEQPLNARFVVEQVTVGLRVETCDGSVKGFVKAEGLEKMIKELMVGEMGEAVRKRVKVFADMADKAVKEGGSSWSTLKLLVDEATLANKNLDNQSGGFERLRSNEKW